MNTGVVVEIPVGLFGQIAARSSTALKGLSVGAGVIDPDYRGEVRVLLFNHTQETVVFEAGVFRI